MVRCTPIQERFHGESVGSEIKEETASLAKVGLRGRAKAGKIWARDNLGLSLFGVQRTGGQTERLNKTSGR